MNKPIFLYVKTHNTTGLKYFGKTIQNPFKYKGSGTRWINHLKVHGYDVTTEIIGEFSNKVDAQKVALKFSIDNNIVESTQWANLKIEDITGGFDHINSLPKDKRVNVKAYKQKTQSGEISCGGTKNWTEESFEKVRKQAKLNRELGLTSGWRQPDSSKHRISEKVSGDKNGNYGNIWCVRCEDLDLTNRKPYKPHSIPEGWISCKEWKENKKDKSNSAYGKHWYNDGVKNYYLYPTDTKILELNLEQRRINIGGCCRF